VFKGKIIVINRISDVKKAVNYLLQQPILGFDTETKPSFKKGRVNKVALLQVSTHDIAFLFQLNAIGITDDIIKLLEDKKITKVGLSLSDDMRALSQRRKFKQGDFIDIQEIVKKIGIEDMSLQKIYANLFGKKISKSKQLSNWNTEILDDKQKKYAALDAYACICIYEKIMELLASHNYILQTVNVQTEAVS
jgi:ribonuclease D